MFILYRDGTRATFENRADSNCDHLFYINLYGVLMKTRLPALKTKEIETIRIRTEHGSVEVDLTQEESIYIMNALNCILETKMK